MRLILQDLAKKGVKEQVLLTIQERLPMHLSEPCEVTVSYHVSKQDDFYLLTTETQAELPVICQRCSEPMRIPYENQCQLAICNSDARAEALSTHYECLASASGMVELVDIITDELILYSPQFHADIRNCDKIIHEFIVN